MSDTTPTTVAIEPDTEPGTGSANDRRALLRKLAVGTAGAAAGVVLLKQGEAGAAGVDPLEIAGTNTSTAPTTLDVTPAGAPAATGPSAFSVGGYNPVSAPFPAAVGGYGDDTIVNGVHGSTTAPGGYGAVAANLATAAPSATDPVPTAQAISSPNGTHVLFVAGSVVGPAAGRHVAGELYVDNAGTLWFTVPGATPGSVRFEKLAGTPTAGAYAAITPQRAYDSRQPNYPVRGRLAPNTSRVISIANGHSANGTVTVTNAIPAGATAAMINLTAADMTGPNFLSVTAGDVASTETSLVNWGAGVTQIANSIVVPLSGNREIKVFCGNQTGGAEFIVDVFGYYL